MRTLLLAVIFLLSCESCFSVGIDLHGNSGNDRVVDDSMALAMKPPRPRSVSFTIQKILDENDPQEVETLNLSGNTLGDDGAEKLSSNLLPRLENLKVLNLSYNIIGEEGLKKLIPSLCSPTLQFVDIFGNDGTDLSSMKTFFIELKDHVTRTYSDDASQKFNTISEKVIFVSASGILSRYTKETVSQTLVSEGLLSSNWLDSHKKYYRLYPQD